MGRPQQFPTAVQDVVVNCVFAAMGESRFNRTLQEYQNFAARLPPLKVLLGKVNDCLEKIHRHSEDTDSPLPLLCRFKAGDERIVYEPYPRKISYETLRSALTVTGFRSAPRRHKSL